MVTWQKTMQLEQRGRANNWRRSIFLIVLVILVIVIIYIIASITIISFIGVPYGTTGIPPSI